MTELVEDYKPKLVTLTYDERDEEKLAKKKRYKDFIDVAISEGKIHSIIGEHRDEGWHPHIAIPKKSLIPYPLQDDDEIDGWIELDSVNESRTTKLENDSKPKTTKRPKPVEILPERGQATLPSFIHPEQGISIKKKRELDSDRRLRVSQRDSPNA